MKRRTIVNKVGAAIVAVGLLLGTTSAIVPATPAEAGTCTTWQYKLKRTVIARDLGFGPDVTAYKGWYLNSQYKALVPRGDGDGNEQGRYGNLFDRDKNRKYMGKAVALRHLDYVTCW